MYVSTGPCSLAHVEIGQSAKPIYTKVQLKERLEQEWNSVDQQLCLDLIDSMPSRIQKCLKANGGHFI